MRDSTSRKILGKYDKKEVRTALIFILPTLLFIFSFLIYPVIYAFYISLFDLDLRRPNYAPFIGLGNYIYAFQSEYFFASIRNTIIYATGTISLSMLLGLGISILMNEEVKGIKIFRSLLLLPWATPPIVAALMWKWIFHPDFGLVNGLLLQLGILQDRVSWLGNPTTAMLALILTDVWMSTPFVVLMILPFIQSIPPSIMEAAMIDGASTFSRFRSVMLPLIKPGLLISIVLRTMGAFLTFSTVYVLTGGGPGGATEVIAYHVWSEAFGNLRFGYSAALSYILCLIIVALMLIYLKVLKFRVEY